MKILIRYPNHSQWPGEGMNYHSFFLAMSKVHGAEVIMAGPGYKQYVGEETLTESIERLYGNDTPDLVIDADNNFEARFPKDREYKVGVFVSDLHAKHDYKISTPEGFRDLIANSDYDLIFNRYLKIYGTKLEPNTLVQTGKRHLFVPWSFSGKIFHPINKRIDVTFLGATYDCYPIRADILANLKREFPKYRTVAKLRPPYRTSIRKLLAAPGDKYHVGIRNGTILGKTKIFIFDCSVYRYPIQKFFEGMGSGCLVMSNAPSSARALGIVNGDTFVEINNINWRSKLRYYLTHEDEAAKIARKGLGVATNYHNHHRRANTFIEMMRKHV